MKISKLSAATVAIIAVLATTFVLSGCDTPSAGGNSATGQETAKSQFLADRGGSTTPASGTGASAPGTAVPGAAAGAIPRVFGTVEKVEGDKITLKSAVDGTETVVQLAQGATVHKQTSGQLSDIKAGESVTASGTQDGETLGALTVQIGDGAFGGRGGFGGPGAGFGGPPAGFGTPGAARTPGARPNGAFPAGTPVAGQNGGFPVGTPPAGFPGPGQPNASGTPLPRSFVSGTVQKVEGDTVTVETADGSTATFKTGADTSVQKQVEVPVSEIAVGSTITATGTATASGSDGAFEANSVQLVEGFPGRQTTGTATPQKP